MTPEERSLIEDLFQRLRAADTGPKDPEAQALLQQAFAAVPGAPYMLVQMALIHEQALKNATAKIAALEQAAAGASAGQGTAPVGMSFLGGALSGQASVPARTPAPSPWGQPQQPGGNAGPWGQSQPQGPGPWGGQSQPMADPAPQGYAPQAGYSGPVGGGGGFLGSMLQTAAGVAAGSLLFSGVSSLFHGGFGGGGYGGGGFGSGFGGGAVPGGGAVEENVTNNYYGDDNSTNEPAAPADDDTALSQGGGQDDAAFDTDDSSSDSSDS